MKELDEFLPTVLEDLLNRKLGTEKELAFVRQDAMKSDSIMEDHSAYMVPVETQNDQVCLQSMQMLKARAALEEKLKQKGVFSSITPKRNGVKRNLQPLNGQLETLDDFDDDTMDIEGGRCGLSNGHALLSHSSKLSEIVTHMK